ncbi:MAG TPA: hypothetical protein VGX75_14430 [bacterium]|nr:hypothetical protein [bacterium]
MAGYKTATPARLNRRRFLSSGVGLLGAAVVPEFIAVPVGGSTSAPDVAATTGAKRSWTSEERQLIAALARLEGRPLTEQGANLAVEQAKWFGEL